MSGRGLTGLSLPELRSLCAAVEHGELGCPVVETELVARGCGGDAVRDILAALGGLDRVGALAVLRVAVAERELRAPPHLDLVWTGPETRLGQARDTAVLVRELFEAARTSVLIAGYAFDHGRDIFAALHAAMRDRGVVVEVFMDVPRAPAAPVETHVREYVSKVFAENWPFGPPYPAVHYDPRTVSPGSTASLHAKCVVVDARHTLITSANFTDRGQTRNLELGVLVDDPDFGARVVGQWRALANAGLLETVAPPGR